MNRIATLAAAFLLITGLASPSEANPFRSIGSAFSSAPKITATISIAEQRMVVRVTNRKGVAETYVWKVSTGKSGYETPTGQWKPTWLSIDHRSKTYDDAPMPYAVFFTGGYAIHATDAVSRLGKPASHGCVRLAKENAAFFFKLVDTYGKRNTRIIVTG